MGTPQGAVILPLLANVFLHYVLDQWVKEWRTTQARGDVIIVRYADDFVMGFQHGQDTKNLLEALKERLEEYKREHGARARNAELTDFSEVGLRRAKRRGGCAVGWVAA